MNKIATYNLEIVTTTEAAIEQIESYMAWNGYDENDSEPINLSYYEQEDDEAKNFGKFIVYPCYGYECENTGRHCEQIFDDSDLKIVDTEEEAQDLVEKNKADFIKKELAEMEWIDLPFEVDEFSVSVTFKQGSYPNRKKCTITVNGAEMSAYGNTYAGESRSAEAFSTAFEKLKKLIDHVKHDSDELFSHEAFEGKSPTEVKTMLDALKI